MDIEKYKNILSKVLNKPIYSVDVDKVETWVNFFLNDEEYDFVMNKCNMSNEKDKEKFFNIVVRLKHPVIRKKFSKACNRLIYIGNRFISNKEIYLNFEEAGNIFIHGWPGSGKTWYFYSLYERLKGKGIETLFWSFKPFEFENICGDNLIKDSHEFIQRIKTLMEDDSKHILVFIDELSEFLYDISEEEKKWLMNAMKERNNINFICNSQNMVSLIDQFDECATTRICMLCGGKEEELIKMIGKRNAVHLEKYGEMYVSNVSYSPIPSMMRVVRLTKYGNEKR